MKLLIIEDDPDIRDLLKRNFEAEHFVVDATQDGITGSYWGRTNGYDLVILDNILPGKNGLAICEDLRNAKRNIPILILTVTSEIPDKIAFFNAGADDYLTKPFSFEELLARTKALLRRPNRVTDEILAIDTLVINTKKHTVTRDNNEIYLTRKEFLLLEYLMRNIGNPISRGMIMEHVWDRNGDIFSNTIETHILNLRRKIDAKTTQKVIHTIPGRGYKIGLGR